MSNALVKRLCNALEAQHSGELVRHVELPRPVLPSPAPEIWTPRRAEGGAGVRSAAVARVHSSPIELVRCCAVYDEFWLAAYEPGRNGEYEFFTSRPLPKHQQNRYSAENIITLPAGFQTDVEQCACCLTRPHDDSTGGVLCDRCGARVCFGRTSQSGYFRCRKSCGREGQLSDGEPDARGLTPGRRGGNFGT